MYPSPRKLRLWNNLLAVLILVTATPLGVAPDGKFHKPFGAMAALETTSLQRWLQREEAFDPLGRLWPPYQIWVREATHLVSGVCVNSVAFRKLYIHSRMFSKVWTSFPKKWLPTKYGAARVHWGDDSWISGHHVINLLR